MKNKEENTLRIDIPKTLSQSIYTYLKDSITKSELKENQKVNEKQIADVFQVSRTPVREALVRLAAEGFVEINHHREATVKEISLNELKEIYQVIGVLDTWVTTLAVDHISDDDLVVFEKITNEMEHFFNINDVYKYLESNYTLHTKIWQLYADENRFAYEILQDCITKVKRCKKALARNFRSRKKLENSINSHKKILEALKNRDKKKLKNLISKHWVTPSP